MTLRLAIFDLDGTLKQERDPYVYLHKRLGTWEASQSFFPQGLAGHIPYAEWLRLDASLWIGVERATLERLFAEVPYLPGAPEAVRELQQRGLRIAIVSTGLSLHAAQVADELGADVYVANEVLFDAAGRVSGETRVGVPEGGKGPVVETLQARFGVGSEETLAVGDGTSDVAMFERAALAVAVAPISEQVRAAADIVLEQPDLRPLIGRIVAYDAELLRADRASGVRAGGGMRRILASVPGCETWPERCGRSGDDERLPLREPLTMDRECLSSNYGRARHFSPASGWSWS